jgi:hypothetical protein
MKDGVHATNCQCGTLKRLEMIAVSAEASNKKQMLGGI